MTMVLMTTSAQAYVRTQTCDPTGIDEKRLCAPDQQPLPIQWDSVCLTVFVNREGSDDFKNPSRKEPNIELLAAIQQSLDPWNNVACSNISVVYGGLTCNRRIGKAQRDIRGGQMNTILWQESFWNHSESAIAITTVNFNPETGAIIDADIEMNGFDYRFDNLDQNDTARMDIRNTLTHEIGHLLGLDHELEISEATMFPSANSGELFKRDLHPDDEQGLCAIYPTQGLDLVCRPIKLEDNTCLITMEGEVSCATMDLNTPLPDTPWWLITCLLSLVCGLGIFRRQSLEP